MARKISVEIVGDARSLEKAFSKSSKSAKRFQGDMDKTNRKGKSTFGGLGRVAGFAAGAIGTYGLAQGVRAVVGEMSEAQKVGAQTGAVIKSTGGAANVSAKQVDALAESLLKKCGVDDEVIKSGENMLLTFTNIRNEQGKGNKIFDEATKATLDLSVATGKDMTNAAVLVGKALNDPKKGLTALRRVGVQFTDAQEDQIKALVKSGKTMDAQKIILRELQKEFGGGRGGRRHAARQAQHSPQHALERRRHDRPEAHPGDHQGCRQDRQLAEQDEEPREDHQRVRDRRLDSRDNAEDATNRLRNVEQDRRRQRERNQTPGRRLRRVQSPDDRQQRRHPRHVDVGTQEQDAGGEHPSQTAELEPGKIAARGVIPVAIALSIYFAGKYARQAANWLAGTEFGKKHKWVGGGTVAATGAQAARLRGMSPSDQVRGAVANETSARRRHLQLLRNPGRRQDRKRSPEAAEAAEPTTWLTLSAASTSPSTTPP